MRQAIAPKFNVDHSLRYIRSSRTRIDYKPEVVLDN
jgi:hypothetical protein